MQGRPASLLRGIGAGSVLDQEPARLRRAARGSCVQRRVLHGIGGTRGGLRAPLKQHAHGVRFREVRRQMQREPAVRTHGGHQRRIGLQQTRDLPGIAQHGSRENFERGIGRGERPHALAVSRPDSCIKWLHEATARRPRAGIHLRFSRLQIPDD